MSTVAERAHQRRMWPVSKAALGSELQQRGPEDPTAAWNAVVELSLEAYELAGITLSLMPRAQWPSYYFRPGEPRTDSNGL